MAIQDIFKQIEQEALKNGGWGTHEVALKNAQSDYRNHYINRFVRGAGRNEMVENEDFDDYHNVLSALTNAAKWRHHIEMHPESKHLADWRAYFSKYLAKAYVLAAKVKRKEYQAKAKELCDRESDKLSDFAPAA